MRGLRLNDVETIKGDIRFENPTKTAPSYLQVAVSSSQRARVIVPADKASYYYISNTTW
jgi:hypothetical protein